MSSEVKTVKPVKKSAAGALEQLSLKAEPKAAAAPSPEAIAALPKEVIAAPVKQTTKIEVKASGEKEYTSVKDETKELETKFFLANPVRIFTDYARTINMGNYESAKISVGLSIPIGPEISDDMKALILDRHKWATELIGTIVTEEEKGIRAYLREQK